MAPPSHTQAPCPLRIVIVGAGLGGLAAAYTLGRAGHKVTVLESLPKINKVGAGIQMSPNASRLLIRWGLGGALEKIGVVPQRVILRRYENGETMGYQLWGEQLEKESGSPYYHVHRADLHQLLHDAALPYMDLRLSCKVVSLDPETPSVTLASGEVIKADFVLGADGVGSRIRDVVVGKPDRPIPTGDAAYRAVISTESMMDDPELRELVEERDLTFWMGPETHIVSYCISGQKEYNIVMIHPDRKGKSDENTRDVDCEIMIKDFEGYEPRVQKLLRLVPSTQVWSLMDREPLPSWVHPEGKVCLLGDACHPMLPYRAQGAVMAIEDGAVLGALFTKVTDVKQIPSLLHIYQSIRHPRATQAQLMSRANQRIFHYPDGPEQQARDKSMKETLEAAKAVGAETMVDCPGNANAWADKAKSAQIFGYDAEEDVEKWWKANAEFVTMGKW